MINCTTLLIVITHQIYTSDFDAVTWTCPKEWLTDWVVDTIVTIPTVCLREWWTQWINIPYVYRSFNLLSFLLGIDEQLVLSQLTTSESLDDVGYHPFSFTIQNMTFSAFSLKPLLKLRDLISKTKDLDGKFEMLVDAVSQAEIRLFPWKWIWNPMSNISDCVIQVETESDAKVAKTLVFANSKWESLANFSRGEINVLRDACISFPPVDGFLTPRFVDEGNPPDIFLLQVSEKKIYIYIYNDSDRKGPSCRAFGTSQRLRTTVDAITWRLSDARIRRHHVLLFEAEDETKNHGWINPLLFFWGVYQCCDLDYPSWSGETYSPSSSCAWWSVQRSMQIHGGLSQERLSGC